MQGDFSCPGGKYISLYADNVTNIQQVLPYFIVQGLVFSGTDLIALDIELYFTAAILKDGKRSLSHIPYAHDPACHAAICEGGFIFLAIICFNRICKCVNGI